MRPETALRMVVLSLLVSLPLALQATTQIDFTLDDLVRKAEHTVRVTVAEKECRPESCRYVLKVTEVLGDSHPGAELVLEQATFFEAAPELHVDAEYVLFLKPANRLERVLGLQLGTLRIRDNHVFDYWDRPVTLSQNRVRHTSGTRAQAAAHLSLDELRTAVRERYRLQDR